MTYEDRYNKYKGRIYNNLRVFLYFISASQIHINWLLKKIRILTKTKGSLANRKPRSPNSVPLWRIKFSKNEAIQLLKWIYYQDNLPCLERKRMLIRKIFNLVENEKRKVYTKI